MSNYKLVNSQELDNTFTQIANAIREKSSSEDTFTPENMAEAIKNIEEKTDWFIEYMQAGRPKDIVIPEGISTIPGQCFAGWEAYSIYIPNSVSLIEKNAFLC